jgi:outer membrane protein
MAESCVRRPSPLSWRFPATQGILRSRPWRKAKRSLLILLTGHLSASACAAIPVQAETLSEAMASAYSTNPSLLAARKELSRTDEQVPQALAFWRPQANVVAGGGYIKDLSGQESTSRTATTQFSTTDGPTAVLNLQVRQPIYNFSNAPRVRQAEEQVRSGRARLIAVEQDVLLRTATVYLDLVRAEASFLYSTDYEDALQKSLAMTRRQFDLGLVRNSSIAEAESRLAAATAQRVQAEGAVASARGNYAQVIGKAPDTVAMPDMPSGIPANANQVVEASSSNPTLVAATYEEKAAREGVDVASGQKLPEFGVQATVNPNSASVL